MASLDAYDPSDTLQQGFLSALALGETGGSNYAATEGVGGSNLAGAATDQYGFPQWTGLGNSHAAGIFQFQPGTWDSIASQFGLNFQNASDQQAGAWYLAEQTYAQKTGGSLEQALQAGNYSSIQNALAGIWPSVTGNQANPTGLASILGSYLTGASNNQTATNNASSGPAAPASSGSSGGSSGSSGSSGGFLSSIIGGTESLFQRGGLIVIGAVIIAGAAWALLREKDA